MPHKLIVYIYNLFQQLLCLSCCTFIRLCLYTRQGLRTGKLTIDNSLGVSCDNCTICAHMRSRGRMFGVSVRQFVICLFVHHYLACSGILDLFKVSFSLKLVKVVLVNKLAFLCPA